MINRMILYEWRHSRKPKDTVLVKCLYTIDDHMKYVFIPAVITSELSEDNYYTVDYDEDYLEESIYYRFEGIADIEIPNPVHCSNIFEIMNMEKLESINQNWD